MRAVRICCCEQARFCVEVFYAPYMNIHSFIHALGDKTENGLLTTTASLSWLNLFDCGLTQHSHTPESLHKHNVYVEDMDLDNRYLLE